LQNINQREDGQAKPAEIDAGRWQTDSRTKEQYQRRDQQQKFDTHKSLLLLSTLFSKAVYVLSNLRHVVRAVEANDFVADAVPRPMPGQLAAALAHSDFAALGDAIRYRAETDVQTARAFGRKLDFIHRFRLSAEQGKIRRNNR
jgi:hypothetical protein